MANKEELFEALKEVLVDRLKVEAETIVPQANLLDDLGLDSIDLMTMVMALEERFGIEVPDEEVEGVETVQQALDLLAKKAAVSA